jgi:hypothetical protein
MVADLFSQPPQYTIDSSSLMDIFSDEKMVSKSITPGLWTNVEALLSQGVIISHIEVLHEVKKQGGKGEELHDWAHANDGVFQEYNWEAEGRIIKLMSPKFCDFVNAKVTHVHADPWLIAQAKHQKLTLISEEKWSGSKDARKAKLPNVCADPLFGVRCIDLLGLIKEQNWKFR